MLVAAAAAAFVVVHCVVLPKQGKTIALCWIPSHVGISGNEKADSAAKDGLSLTVTALKSPASELLPRATKLISEKWQKSWNNCTGNKLQSINPTIGVYQHVRSLSRRDAVIIHRLRIGHTRLTHSYLFRALINRSVRLVISQ